MKFLTKTLVIAALSFVGAFAFTTLTTSVATAHEGEDHSGQIAQAEGEQQEESDEETSDSNYTFTAQSGDSYSLIARKAIQIYGIENEQTLSEAEIIAAETWLTQDANSPLLNEGQEVSLSATAVQGAVDRAMDLSDEQEALWQPYADNANFDTNNVGE